MQLNKLSRGAKLSALVVVLVAIDQIVKLAVHHYLEVGDRIEVFHPVHPYLMPQFWPAPVTTALTRLASGAVLQT